MADLQIGSVTGAGSIAPVSAPQPAPAGLGEGAGQLNLGLATAAPGAGGQQNAPEPTHDPGALPNAEKLKSAVGKANTAMATSGTQMVFVFDDHAHHMSVKLLDVQTQKVVQELQPQAAIKAAQGLSGDKPTSGALVDTTA